MPMQITAMDKSSYKDAAAIMAQCLSHPWSENVLFQELSNPNAHSYVAFENGEAAGFLSVWEVCGEVSINNIAVVEKFRRRGIAKALMEHMFTELCDAVSATLEVRRSNDAAAALYRSLGFKRVGERKDFYSRPTEDAILMTKYLNGEE